ncbi:hypothetical protein DFP97_1384 [Paenibacillus prosopidis]|uniref:Uncharacterized protein n=1 Tax=Paenibacillus prosopidis TaxID=630520 RepID=A0A368VMQ0_9BACL|nr:hypothetical protein DFP97_1384 [Paenibacillus prosopidis]
MVEMYHIDLGIRANQLYSNGMYGKLTAKSHQLNTMLKFNVSAWKRFLFLSFVLKF